VKGMRETAVRRGRSAYGPTRLDTGKWHVRGTTGGARVPKTHCAARPFDTTLVHFHAGRLR
jgi:hypothetical protein